jgi:hypothetical protein
LNAQGKAITLVNPVSTQEARMQTMQLRRPQLRRQQLVAIAALTATMLAVIASAAAERAAAAFQPNPGCDYRDNVSVIVDDSGSTSSSDSNKLRAAGVKFLISRQINATGFPPRTLSAVEFGSRAASIFGPTPLVAGNQAAMEGALDARILADDGGTNYVDAFKFANLANPTHDARIFFTDGQDGSFFQNEHLPGPKTHVLGLSVYSSDLLDRIAAETGGFHIPLDEASQVPVQMDRVFADLSCIDPPIQKPSTAASPGQTKTVLKAPVAKEDRVLSLAIFTGAIASGNFEVQIKDRRKIAHRVTSSFGEAGVSAKGDGCSTKARKPLGQARRQLGKARRGLRVAQRRGASGKRLAKAGKRLRKAKSKLRKAKRRKSLLRIDCKADSSYLLMELKGKKGARASRALGKNLIVRLKTKDEAYSASGADLTTSLTRDD